MTKLLFQFALLSIVWFLIWASVSGPLGLYVIAALKKTVTPVRRCCGARWWSMGVAPSACMLACCITKSSTRRLTMCYR